jgi:hypothetical protein
VITLTGKEYPRKQNLPPQEEIDYNKSHSKKRIVIEQAIIYRLKKYSRIFA